MIEFTTGDILLADTEAIVNTTNCVGIMGKGLALAFKRRYPEYFLDYLNLCNDGKVTPGTIHAWATGDLLGPRLVLGFPTKRHWRDNSLMEDIDLGLKTLAAVIKVKNVRSVAVAPLGCGNGGLNWADVKPKIVATMEKLDDVRTVIFEPIIDNVH